ncbi:class I SAM-dependent methyltransferase [Micromonospora sp. RTGN7]|uniref:class I SAM-dependent methyltransferase n=1 Tax=Micromonospora sp. RTGN7 TaxID=3016526 RepID=UPI0029FEFF9C|nr:class I SAM-dependent methyltransferase [Micromonospora sp. RTGN7]
MSADTVLEGARPPVPNYAFDPSDPWTTTMQSGLARAGLRGCHVYEVGVGSGTNVVFMLRECGAELVLGSDLDPRLAVLAKRFVEQAAPELHDRFRPIHGAVNLIDVPAALAETAEVDVVVACLPQVPDPYDAMCARFHVAQLSAPAGTVSQVADHIAHYYPWTSFHEYPYNAVGLGLIEALLRRVRAALPAAEVVLNLSCRAGKEVLLRLLRANHYRPEELASRIVRQHHGTDISFFVALEAAIGGTGYERDFVCEFYRDPHGYEPISAHEARERLAHPGEPVYHELCVLRGHPERQRWT